LLRINLTVGPERRIEQLSDLSAPLGHIVPTSVANLDGRFFVGNLGLFPVEVGSSKLYQVTHKGFVIDYWGGFTTIIDVQKDSQGRMSLRRIGTRLHARSSFCRFGGISNEAGRCKSFFLCSFLVQE
jgi:hypothetical protein